MSDEWIKQYRSDHPLFDDLRYQRRVTRVFRPIPMVENMFDVTYECGHSPLIFNDEAPRVGQMLFCPGCYQESLQ